MSTPKQTVRVNVSLSRETDTALRRHAKRQKVAKTALAKILVLDGLARLDSGDFTLAPASITPIT